MSKRKHLPLTKNDDLKKATYDQLVKQIQLELEELQSVTGWNQLSLARRAGYGDQGSISRILRGERNMAKDKAAALDRSLGETPTYKTRLGASFTELAALRDQAKRAQTSRNSTRGSPLVDSPRYDVFLASPMASAGANYEVTRERTFALAQVITDECGYAVYNASADVPTTEDFDQADLAYAKNMAALRNSRHFVLYVTELIQKPSSVWVEAGIAIGMKMPSTLFVPNIDCLPYILQRAVTDPHRTGLPNPVVHWMRDRAEAAHRLVKLHGADLFQLAETSEAARPNG